MAQAGDQAVSGVDEGEELVGVSVSHPSMHGILAEQNVSPACGLGLGS